MTIKFTEGEAASLAKHPEVLIALANMHDSWESDAAAIDPEMFAGSVLHHQERRRELRALATKIVQEDPDCWPDSVRVELGLKPFAPADRAERAAPIDMVLFCPNCGKQHVDAPDTEPSAHPDGRETMWTNPPHRSHLCHDCGIVWRPADVPTNGVADIKTQGHHDSWPVNAEEVTAQPANPSSGAAERAAPAGWKLVPVEPTPEMRKAAADAWLDCGSKLTLNKAAAAVRAGTLAAPSIPSSGAEGSKP